MQTASTQMAPRQTMLRTALNSLFVATTIAGPAIAQCTPQWTPGAVPGANGVVHDTVEWDPDGAGPQPVHIVYGGSFTAIGSIATDSVAMRNTITGEWLALGAGLQGGSVMTLAASPNGDLYAGGAFGRSGTTGTSRLARFDGVSWVPVGGAGANDVVEALAPLANGDLIIGGRFDFIGSLPAAKIAHWDGATWSPLGSGITGPNSYVADLVELANGDIVVGGSFLAAGGVAAGSAALWNGASWSALGLGFPNTTVEALQALPNGEVVAGFHPGIGVRFWNGSTWTSPAPPPRLRVQDFATLATGELVACGSPDLLAGITVGTIGVFDGAAWAPFADTIGSVQTVTATPNGLVAGGDFLAIERIRNSNTAVWDANSGWLPPSDGFSADVIALLETSNGDLIAGGFFEWVDGLARNGIARFDGANWNAIGTGFGQSVLDLVELPNGDLVAAGQVAATGGGLQPRIARWDGSSWQTLGVWPGFSQPTALAVLPDATLIALGINSGAFAWNGTTWDPLPGLQPNGLDLIVAADGTLLASAGSPGQISRWDGSSWQAVTTTVNARIRTILELPNGDLIAGGQFNLAGGQSMRAIARWDGTTWNALGTSPFGIVFDVARLPNGNLIAAGINPGGNEPLLAQWDGANWQSIGGGLQGTTASSAQAIAVRRSGEVVAGGNFILVNGQPSANLARWVPTCPGSAQLAGTGCTGSGGNNELHATTTPWLGATFASSATGMPAQGIALSVLGLGAISTPLNTLLPQAGIGCDLLVTAEILGILLLTGGAANPTISIPNTPALATRTLRQQVVAFELNATGIVEVTSTNALAMTIGSY